MDLRRNSLLLQLADCNVCSRDFLLEQQSVFGAQRIYISKRSAIFRQFIFKSNRQAFLLAFLKYVCRLRLPDFFDDSSVSFNKCCTSCLCSNCLYFWCISSSCNHISNDAFWHHRNIAGSGSFSAALYLLYFWILGTLRASL